MATKSLSLAEPYLISQEYEKYTPEQHEVWGELVRRRLPQVHQHACREYLDGYDAIGLTEEHLPDFERVTERLRPRTGWSIKAVNGFLPGNAFFEMLEARMVPTTTWLRSRDSLDYIAEPDIFHDMLGHAPMHAHPVFADFLQHWGAISAHANDREIEERLGRFFWFTVEFGLIRQDGGIKVYGSGVISSHAECSNVIARGCEIKDFDLDEVMDTPFKIDELQKVLFAIESFDQVYEAVHEAERRIKETGRL
jgi:phenylalanine-4-hydroxylase